MAPTIVVRGLWEEFRVLQDRPGSVKEMLSRLPVGRERRSNWALRDVSFEVEPGETVGLIGRNGSGKSTLLRCIAGILPPTRGEVLVGGPISSLIELGAGFHPELTGRENARVTGALFGIPRRKLEAKMEEIVAFAELEEVVDQPVRSYSSGMVVRLAFSLAVSADPEILLIDEVLAVGDQSFQRRCVDRISGMARSGVAVVFVSHQLDLVSSVCSRVLLLDDGSVVSDGSPLDVIAGYERAQ
ncbi:MAG TPA: ABC transporter ATP-binding protein [Actinomycetota bacterium]|nr:ABC transporter ATP-binding protein [Actinomycetota bacterium]